jgi:hypothetical protein
MREEVWEKSCCNNRANIIFYKYMHKKIYLFLILLLAVILLNGCSMPFAGSPDGPDSGEEADNQGPDSGEDGDNQGPDSGDEIDTSNEPKSPDSGEDGDNQGPDSGEDEDNQGPDSGDEIDTSKEPTSPDSGDEIDPNEPTSPDSGEEISLNDDLKNKAKGSCNRISDGSTCVEYIGSYWLGGNAKLNCGSEAFATTPCPRPSLGGCRIGSDTATEIVTWHYSYGGDPFTEVISYTAQSCTAVGGRWVD